MGYVNIDGKYHKVRNAEDITDGLIARVRELEDQVKRLSIQTEYDDKKLRSIYESHPELAYGVTGKK